MKLSALSALSLLPLLLAAGSPLRAADPLPDRTSVLLATGAKGEDAYATPFARWTTNWKQASEIAGARLVAISEEQTDAKERLKKALEEEPQEGAAVLWVVLLGHGSFDGREGKFNLPGDDLSASELAAWLKPFRRPVVVICGFSASGAFLKPLSAEGRVVVTATRSGAENNYSRLGGYLSEAIASPSADLDKDGQTSLLEAWLAAAQRTTEFYKSEERLATEHSLLDDNGDGFGTPAEWFQGIRTVKKSSDHRAADGLRAHQIQLIPSPAEKDWAPARRAERDRLERDIAHLRESKASREPEEYYKELEGLLLQLAQIYRDGAPSAPVSAKPVAVPVKPVQEPSQ